MDPKNLNKTTKNVGKGFKNALTQTRPQNTPAKNCTAIAVVHNRFRSLVSSKTVYSLKYSPKTRHKHHAS